MSVFNEHTAGPLLTDEVIRLRRQFVAEYGPVTCPACRKTFRPQWGGVGFCVDCGGVLIDCPECGDTFPDWDGDPCLCEQDDGDGAFVDCRNTDGDWVL